MARTVFKPAGIPVFPRHADPTADCVLHRLDHDPSLSWPEGFAGGICHRLDISTSGALLVADAPTELVRIRAHFAGKRLTKRYLFRARKEVPWDDNLCERPIAHHPSKRSRMIVQRGANTRHRGRWYDAHTAFERVAGDLWRATITTGVMHQIRVHAAFVGLPLLGDRHYGGGPPLHPDIPFQLHHEGLTGPDLSTDPVPAPAWAQPRSTTTGA